ncbi:uncharacterized protein [Atheta coriaria]|uniref:uncharacterized protein isoform X1 n=1 Tax=Dalotia coriaria TaxID=877792 RepID=UPI0031F3E184
MLARGDTQTSSMEITDEDLRYSGADYSPSGSRANILEEQIDQLEAQQIDEPKFTDEVVREVIDETRHATSSISKDYEYYDIDKNVYVKSDLDVATTESVKGEKVTKEHKDTIIEEDETQLESVTEETEDVTTKIETIAHQTEKISTDQFATEIDSTAKITDEIAHKASFVTEVSTSITDDSIHSEVVTKLSDDKKQTVGGSYEVTEKSQTKLDDSVIDKVVTESKQVMGILDTKTEQTTKHTEDKKMEGDVEVSTTEAVITTKQTSESKIIDVGHKEVVETSSTSVVELPEMEVEMEKLLAEGGELVITKHEVLRTSSGESSQEYKSPEEGLSSSSSGLKQDELKPVGVIMRKQKHLLDDTSSSSSKQDRKSGIEFEAYSSSGESHYQSFEIDSGRSRPCSSDVDVLVAGGSSEYESALTSQGTHLTSTEYHTAVSSISSKDSMKSLDSESSGHLGSIEVSEASETLIQSEYEGDIADNDLLPEKPSLGERQNTDVSDMEEYMQDELIDMPPKMKRSHEMTFQPEPKPLQEDSPPFESEEVKLATSLDDGSSVLSVSLSSTSSIGAQRTVIEQDYPLSSSIVSDQFSLDDSQFHGSTDCLSQTPVPPTTETSTSTHTYAQSAQIDSVTLSTSMVEENGVQSVSTQVVSQSHTPEEEKDISVELARQQSKPQDIPEQKKRGHRRNESTSFTPSMLPQLTKIDIQPIMTSDITEKTFEILSMKETESSVEVEKEDVAESDVESRPQSQISKTDSERERVPSSNAFTDSELAELAKQSSEPISDPIDRPVSPEPEELKTDVDDGDDIEDIKQIIKDVVIEKKKEILDKRDSHGKSSSTSSEKSSFEEAEADAAFNMVPHVSPAHKAKQICPIMEDEDAEKHELETREKAQKEFEAKKRAMRDVSPGPVPDIHVTEHMTPMDRKGFHYPDLELEEQEALEIKKQQVTDVEVAKEPEQITPETPASASSKSSESTDQGREYVIESDASLPEETDSQLTTDEAKTTTEELKTDTVLEKTIIAEETKEIPSPVESNSDSFEMLEKPDLMDEFVVIEEVAKEAHETDIEGKSVKIKKVKMVKKHDEEVEKLIVRSAPSPTTKMTDIKYYPDGSSSDELGFDFEDSPPNKEEGEAASKSPRDYVYEYDRELEANKKWIEQQFQGDHAAMLAAGYGYEMEFERCPLEDIKEEDAADFDSSRIGSLNSQKNSGGSLGSVKDSYSSTPEYDVLAGRKYFTKSGEHDDVSMSSLQEFENLERAMSLENRKFHTGSQDSSSNGSFKTRYLSRGAQGDEVSVSSLKEFEGLEKACIAAHRVEVMVKEEEMLLAQIDESQESMTSESESCETITKEKQQPATEEDEEDYEKRMFEIDEIIRQAQTNVERFIDLKEGEKTESIGRGDSVEEVSKIPDLDLDTPLPIETKTKVLPQWTQSADLMLASTDSLDLKDSKPAHHGSTDSLEQKTGVELMTASTDSIELQAKLKGTIMTDSLEMKHGQGLISSDSLELATGNIVAGFSDSIDEDGSRIGGFDQSSSSTGKDLSCSKEEEPIDMTKPIPEMVESTDSIASTSTATRAMYQYETDSMISGSFTSEGSNTMVSSTDNIDPVTGEPIDLSDAVRQVWFGDDQDEGEAYVTEVIEPGESEITHYTFSGPTADDQMQQLLQDFNEGEEVVEETTTDEHGNVHVRRTIKKRIIVKDDGTESIIKRTCIDDKGTKTIYTQEFSTAQPDTAAAVQSLLSHIAGDVTGESSVTWQESTVTTTTTTTSSQKAFRRRPMLLEISLDDKTMIEVDPREHDWRFNLPLHAEDDERKADGASGTSNDVTTTTTTRTVTDPQHLSEEMKQLLKEMEEQGKK